MEASMWWILACTHVEPGSASTPPPTPPSTSTTTPDIERPSGDFGLADALQVVVADRPGATLAAADLDGDGDDDLLFGAYGDDTIAGALYAASYPLSPSSEAEWIGETAGDQAGYALAAGDVDGDGVMDAVVGAFGADRIAPDAGVAYLVTAPLGAGGSLADAPGLVVDTDESDQAGLAVAVGNWLGEPTLAIGACMEDTGGDDAGAAFLLPLPDGGETDLHDAVRITGEHAGDASGSALSSGDVDGDGLDDLADGAWLDDTGGEDSGSAYLLLGPIDGDRPLADADLKLVGEGAGDFAGSPFGIAGDLTGDGLPDLVAGAWFQDALFEDAGAVYVVAGTRRGTVSFGDSDAVFRGGDAGASWGQVAIGPGDVDGDGNADLLIGAPLAGDTGKVGLYWGPVSGTLGPAPVTFFGGQTGDLAGMGLAFGDLDGDGRSEVLIGAGAGAAYVFSVTGF